MNGCWHKDRIGGVLKVRIESNFPVSRHVNRMDLSADPVTIHRIVSVDWDWIKVAGTSSNATQRIFSQWIFSNVFTNVKLDFVDSGIVSFCLP